MVKNKKITWEKCAKRGSLGRLKRAVTRGEIADFLKIYLKKL